MDDIRTGFGLCRLESLKNKASYLLKDSLKIARIALVDVSNAELMTEEATNADEWGPTTTQMAEISCSMNNSEDYLRIVPVLHKRFALNTHKFWRQIHKSLILLEYLLCHGPEDLVMEFRQDKSHIEEFTRFVYVDLNGIDRGSAVRRRAKHVLQVLLDESFYKQERTRAQKTSSGISGFGNDSVRARDDHHHHHRPSTQSTILHSLGPRSQSASLSSEIGFREEGWTSLLREEEQDPVNEERDAAELGRTSRSTEREFCAPGTSWRTSSWRSLSGSSSSGAESASASGRSTHSTGGEVNAIDLSSFPTTSHTLDLESLASGLKNTRRTPSLQRLPPPPPVAGYRGVQPKPKASRAQSELPPTQVSRGYESAPDLISI